MISLASSLLATALLSSTAPAGSYQTHGFASTSPAFQGGSRPTGVAPHDSGRLRLVRELKALRREALARQAANGGELAEVDRAELQARLDQVRQRYFAQR